MDGEVFGHTPEGETVHVFRISGGGLMAHVINWGAAVQDLRLAGHDAPLVLGYEAFDDYFYHSPYFGATAGRYANRIANGRFVIDGRHCQTDPNFLGRHTLHGGAKGFGTRIWDVALHGPDFVTFSLRSANGEMGFPGAMDVTCTYRLKIPGTLSIEYAATAEEPTLCNLAHHSYFNLDNGGSGDILDHDLSIMAGAYLPVDSEMIPTGFVHPVDGTVFDFRRARPIRLESEGEQVPYDHNFCLAASRGPLRHAATASGARSGVRMELWTTEPGVQFYAGQRVERPGTRGLGGRSYRAYAGFCLEAQVWPDSPNRHYFPQAALWPGQRYHQITEYRFRID
ncbi:aldose epimerase family protein [Arvimicrobium flavum]|uniref:aldose epimerase family protein n=1 Tax=Arvimicrobium flavum TaxID=3393320 RepID=UPI00237C11B0|nr:aldose epimerase family protein [Mesorhizobium shangrilense]